MVANDEVGEDADGRLISFELVVTCEGKGRGGEGNARGEKRKRNEEKR